MDAGTGDVTLRSRKLSEDRLGGKWARRTSPHPRMASKRKAPAAEEEGGGEEVDQESRINKLQKEK
eukprot:COSAG04_NODE_234_length_19155_cov_812.438707_19_plen_65_part_01